MGSARFKWALSTGLFCLGPSFASTSVTGTAPSGKESFQQQEAEALLALKQHSAGVDLLPAHGVGQQDVTPTTNIRSGSEDSSSVLSFTSSNSYTEVAWSPWTHHLAEPYRSALLKADSTQGDLENDVFMWTLPGDNGAVYEGR